MDIIVLLKRNFIVRAIYLIYRRYLAINRSGFGHVADNATITLPLWLERKRNIYLYENTNLAANSYISAYNAKFTIKKN